jgi:uncharacterized repeat protein (TIGR02543 family)
MNARWTLTAYTIRYALNGGTGAADRTYTIESAAITLPSPVKTGYAFAGWFNNSDFSGEAATSIAAGSFGDKTFYARWTAIVYTVRYDANGGTGFMESSAHAYDAAKPLVPNDFTRTGYSFGGWNTRQNGSGTGYTEAQSVTNLAAAQSAVVTLYAQWRPVATVNIAVWADEAGNILVSNAGLTLSRGGSGGRPSSFTATANGAYSDVRWYLDGAPLSGAQSAVINAADYSNGSYYLGVTVTKDGAPYSTDIHFTVTD